MPDLFDGFSRAGTALSKITSGDWDGLVENIKALASPVGMLGAGYVAANVAVKAVPAVGGAVVSGAAQYLTFKSMLKLVTPGTADVGDGMKAARINPKLIKGGIAGLIFAGLYAAIDPIMNFMRKDDNFTADDIEKTEIPIGMQVGGLAGAATIAALFIPGGAVAMAVGGVAAFIVGGALRVVDYYKDDDMLPNKLEKVHAAHKKSQNQLGELMDLRERALQLGLDPTEIDKEIADLKAKIAKDREKFRANFVESFGEDEASIAEAQAGIERLQGETLDEYRARKFRGNKRASNSTSDATLMERMIGEVNDLQDIIDLNKKQLEESQKYGASLGFTNEQMGIIGDYAIGTGMTVAKRDAIIEERKANREASLKKQSVAERNAEFQEYLKKNGIDFTGSYTDVALKAMKEQNTLGGLGGGTINVFNQGGDTITPITMSTGGAKTATTILQGFNQGNGMGYCPVPGLLGT
jgi:hypothetical protein